MLTYRKMTLAECEKINDMDAAQYIGRAWREVDGERKLIEIDYLDPTWPNGYEVHYNNLKATISSDGEAVGAFDEKNQLKGFVTVNRMNFGQSASHALLDQLFVSRESRGQGIGKRLFLAAVEIAQSLAVDNLFICAGSAEETIAFYRSLGCIEAKERHNGYYESDSRDLQMEFPVNS